MLVVLIAGSAVLFSAFWRLGAEASPDHQGQRLELHSQLLLLPGGPSPPATPSAPLNRMVVVGKLVSIDDYTKDYAFE